MCFTGRHVAADEAADIHLADKVVAPEYLIDVALEDAEEWAKGPTRAYWAIKKAMGEGNGLALESSLSVERAAFEDVFATEDARAGIMAFVSKGKATFSGK
jgi:enoyl-CoA hydratase/carnithine racemase